MAWNGTHIKDLAQGKGLTLMALAESVGVSRQALDKWIKGQTPTGSHLVRLCRVLGIAPEVFFSEEGSITAPVHRTRGRAKRTEVLQAESLELARHYELFFRQAPPPGLVPSLRIANRESEDAARAARMLRDLAGAEGDAPLTATQVFRLYERLKINLIAVPFPERIKDYAFYAEINGHRVVFLNDEAKRLDMTFALVHEAVHAARDEACPTDAEAYAQEEEDFCDRVASLVQYPDSHVDAVHAYIHSVSSAGKVALLKQLCLKEEHAIYGLAKRIGERHPHFALKVGGADTNLKKEVETVGEFFLSAVEPRKFLDNWRRMSPVFVGLLEESADRLSPRMLGELLRLDWLDAKEVKRELLQSAARA